MLSWCVTQSMRLDDQFTQTRSILLSSSPLPASLLAADQSQLLSATVSHVQPLLHTVDSLLSNADPTQAALPPSSAIAGYSLTSPFANMTGLASNVHEESNSASVGSGSGTRERGVAVLTSGHASCLERMDVAHKHLVLQAMISKMIKAAVHTLKLRERERYAAARTSGRRSTAGTGGGSRDVTDAEYARLTEAQRSCGDQLSRVMARLDAAKETLEWLWRDYRLCTVSHSVNETLRVLRGIQRKWAGRTPYVYPRKLGMGEAAGAAASARPGQRRSSASNAPPSTTATPSALTSPSSPPASIFQHSTQSPLSPVLSLHTGTQQAASSSAFTFSPINSPPQRQLPPPIPPHLLASVTASQSSSSLLSGQQQHPPPPPPPPPSAVGASAHPASLLSPSIQSMNSIYSSTTSHRHQSPSSAPVSDVYDLRFWIHELEKRQRLLDYAAQANERSALVSALRTMDESFTASVSSFKVANMSPRLVTLLQLQHKAFLYRDDLRRAIVNMNARLTTLDTAITKLKEESFRLYKGSGREVDIGRNTEQMQVVMGEAQTEKRACRDMFKFFHAAVAQHVYSRLEQEVTLQAVDVHALYRELQKVERACLAMFGHVSAEPPHLMFSLGQAEADQSRSGNGASASLGAAAGQSSVPRKVIVHYDKDKQGEIENARFSPHAVAELIKQKHGPLAAGPVAGGGGGGGLLPPPQLSPVGRRVMRRIGSDGKEEEDGGEYEVDDVKDDGRGLGVSSNVGLLDDDGDEKEERKEIIIRQSVPLRSSPHSTSTSISRPARPATHTRARSESARSVTDAAAERVNLMEFMRRRQAGADGAAASSVIVSSAERKERDRERDREREPSTASVDSQSSNRGRERTRGSRPPSVDWSPDRHLSMPTPAMMEQSVSPTAAASRGLSPIRPQLPPRPRRASSGMTDESAAALRSPVAADGSNANAVSLPSAEAAARPSALPPNVTPIAVISPQSSSVSSPTAAPSVAAALSVPPPLPASYQPPQPAEATEEPLMTLQQLLAKAQAASPPVPPSPVQATVSSPSAGVSSPVASYPQSASRASPVGSSAYLSPTGRSNSPVMLSAIPRRFNPASSYSPPPPRMPSSLLAASRSEASPSPTRIPVMSPPRAAPLSSSAEAAIVLRNTAMNRSEYERLPAKGMENLSVRERILRLQQRKEEEEAQQAGGDDDDGRRGKEDADYSRIKLRPVAPPRLSDSQVRRSLDTAAAGRAGVGGGGIVASHSRHRSTPNLPSSLVASASGSELVSAPLPPLDGLPQHSVASMQLSPATRELLQRGGQRGAAGGGESSFFYSGKDAQPHTVYIYNTQQ